jgi:PAS domain S-box-containing protein
MKTNPIKILLIEDNPDDAELLLHMLAEIPSADFELRHTERLGEALERLVEESFDAVFLDLGLPDSQGLETLCKIRHQFPGVPVLVLTGLDDQMLGVKAVQEGAQDYLVKGQVNGETLVRAVRYAIERKRVEEELRRAHDELELRVQERTAELREANEKLQIEIQERKQAEEQIRRLSSAVEQSIDGIVISDLKSKLIYLNDAFAQMHGYSRAEMIGMKIENLHNEDQMDEMKSVLQQLETTGSWMGEIGHARKDGTHFPAYMSITLLTDDEGNSTEFMGIVRNITDQKELEAQLRQSQKMEAIGRLAGGVAHDFNNVLTAIIGYADLILMGLAEDDRFRRDLVEIRNGGQRAASLTRQLLAFSRRQILQPVVLDLNTVIIDFVKMLERLLGEDVELKTVLASGLRRVKADPGQMEQVVMNLAVNSRDAMPRGGKLTIETVNVDLDEDYARGHEIRLQPGPYVMLGVSDTGKGMDKETQSLIFEPFFTTKEKGKGTGLGLATVYGIVKQSGGYIWVYSEPGKGTTFKIYLPAVGGEAIPGRQEGPTSPERLAGTETILIVEDDDGVRNLACQILRPQGYTILEAKDGMEALRVNEEHGDQIHLMITDVVMPGMSGKEVEERLRPLRPDIKVIYMSGYTDNAILRHGLLSPEVEFLQKPFALDGLKRKVREVLNKPQKRKEAKRDTH